MTRDATTNRVAAVIRCTDFLRGVLTTIASVEGQTVGVGELVLVVDASTPARAREWLMALGRTRDLRVVEATTSTPGAGWNAGIEACGSPFVTCVDAGDSLESSYHEAALAAFDDAPNVDVVSSAVLCLGPGSERRILPPPPVNLPDLLAETETQSTPHTLRRATWSSLGGFDDSLHDLEAYDLELRLLQKGRHIVRLDHPHAVRVIGQDAAYYRRWDQVGRSSAMASLVERHEQVFALDPARVLSDRERCLQDLGRRYSALMDRRRTALAETGRLTERSLALRLALPEDQRDGVDLGDLRRTTPISREWGYDRGRPVDRYYIEQFLLLHADDIRGVVLEIQEPDYTARFGGDRVLRSDVVDLNAENPRATVVSDLRSAGNIASNSYDCIILTQTLHVIGDMTAVVRECARILRPGGVLLATLPTASRVCLEYGQNGDFWRVTEAGAREVFSQAFPHASFEVSALGNVVASTAFLFGLAAHEFSRAELEATDPYLPLLVTVRAVKPVPFGATRSSRRAGTAVRSEIRAAILLHHRVAVAESDVHGLAVSPADFRAELAYLTEHYRPVSLEHLVAITAEGDPAPGAVALTFDDGYVDNLEVAGPILAEFGVSATFFVTTDCLDDDDPYEFWWDALERSLLVGSEWPHTMQVDLPAGPRTFDTATLEGRLAAHASIYHAIVGMPAERREAVVRAVTAWRGPRVAMRRHHRRMTRDEIVRLASQPTHSIGAHSVRHLLLPRQPTQVQVEEVIQSKRALEALLDRPVTSFAYPFGACDAVTVSAVRDASFTTGVICEDKPLPSEADRLRLPRLEVSSRNGPFGVWIDRHLRNEKAPAR